MRQSIQALCLVAAMAAAPLAMAMGPEHGMPKGDISKADFLKKMENRFDMMDTNKDGVLSEAERKAARDMMRERHEQRKAERASGAASK